MKTNCFFSSFLAMLIAFLILAILGLFYSIGVKLYEGKMIGYSGVKPKKQSASSQV